MHVYLLLAYFATSSFALYPPGSNVIELTPSNFDKLVISGDEIWVVEFFVPWCGHCQKLAPEYQKAAKVLKGIIKVGAVNVEKHESLASRYKVDGYIKKPTIKIFGEDKNKPEDFNGQRTAEGIIDAAVKAAKNKIKARLEKKSDSTGASTGDVTELTDSNFNKLVMQSEDMWIVEFYALWCGHCKNLAPQWARAATELKGKVKFGAMDATAHGSTALKYGVQGYPTIKVFTPGKKGPKSVSDYEAGRTAEDIVAWALDQLAENIPEPEFLQITDQHTFSAACKEKPLCVLAFFPHILDCHAECRNGYIKMLKDLGEIYKKKLWGWIWSEAGAQSDLENALEIGGFGYPAMAVISAKKMKIFLLRGSFSKEGIVEFLRDLSFGRGYIYTLPLDGAKLPKIAAIVSWDGKDGQLPVVEDIDLSDVELDEKISSILIISEILQTQIFTLRDASQSEINE